MKVREGVLTVGLTAAVILGTQHGMKWYDQNHLSSDHVEEARVALAEIDQTRDSIGTESYEPNDAKAKTTVISLNAKTHHTEKDRTVSSNAQAYLSAVEFLKLYKGMASQNQDLRNNGMALGSQAEDSDRVGVAREEVTTTRKFLASALEN